MAGAAAMPMSTFEYFESLDIVLHELMGCTETSGPQATNRKGIIIIVMCQSHIKSEVIQFEESLFTIPVFGLIDRATSVL